VRNRCCCAHAQSRKQSNCRQTRQLHCQGPPACRLSTHRHTWCRRGTCTVGAVAPRPSASRHTWCRRGTCRCRGPPSCRLAVLPCVFPLAVILGAVRIHDGSLPVEDERWLTLSRISHC
jgi:hypothetical protein